MSQIIYILTNEAMPGYVKIGKTGDLETRVKDLSRSTSVPLPFNIAFAMEVQNMDSAEKLLHDAFDNFRVAKNREFFRIAPERVVSALRLTGGKDITPGRDIIESKDDEVALERARSMRPRFHFSYAQIPIGAILNFTRDDSITCEVIDDTKVRYEGEETSITASAAKVLKKLNGRDPGSISGTVFWKYEDEILDDRRRRVEGTGPYGGETE